MDRAGPSWINMSKVGTVAAERESESTVVTSESVSESVHALPSARRLFNPRNNQAATMWLSRPGLPIYTVVV